jgi:uncharacterized protein
MFPSGPVRCAGDLYLPDGIEEKSPAPGVVMGHSVVMVKEALRPHAEYLVRAGFVVLAIDYRTIGSSEGEPRGQWFPERQVEDIRAGVSYLRTRAETDPGRIGVWGHSTASGVAIMAGILDRRIGCVACQNPSMLDAWTALEKSRGRAQMSMIRTLLQEDFDRRLRTGEGASLPALASDDPKLAGYVTQAEELFPAFKNQMTAESLEHVLTWAPVNVIHPSSGADPAADGDRGRRPAPRHRRGPQRLSPRVGAQAAGVAAGRRVRPVDRAGSRAGHEPGGRVLRPAPPQGSPIQAVPGAR